MIEGVEVGGSMNPSGFLLGSTPGGWVPKAPADMGSADGVARGPSGTLLASAPGGWAYGAGAEVDPMNCVSGSLLASTPGG